jgi:hypothetical protein
MCTDLENAAGIVAARAARRLYRDSMNMKTLTQAGAVRVASARMPTRWGVFQALWFEREIVNGTRRVESALALVMGDLADGAPLVRVHS